MQKYEWKKVYLMGWPRPTLYFLPTLLFLPHLSFASLVHHLETEAKNDVTEHDLVRMGSQSPESVPPWQADYFKQKTIKSQQTQEELPLTS